MRSNHVRAISAAALMGLIAACGSTDRDETPSNAASTGSGHEAPGSSSDVASTSTGSLPTPAPSTPAPTNATATTAGFGISTGAGYTFSVRLNATALIANDTANAPPGKTIVTANAEINGSAHNTTVGRTTPNDPFLFWELALHGWWPKSSPVCGLVRETAPGDETPVIVLAGPHAGTYCGIVLTGVSIEAASTPLAADETRPLAAGFQPEPVEVDEQTASSLVADFKSGPAWWSVTRKSSLDDPLLRSCANENSDIYSIDLLWSSIPVECKPGA